MNFKYFLNENAFDDAKETWLKRYIPKEKERTYFYKSNGKGYDISYEPKELAELIAKDKKYYDERYKITVKQIDDTLLKFKQVKDLITEPEKKDIGYWVKLGYPKLSSFLQDFEYYIREKKLDKAKGKNATKIFENDKALVVLPKTLEASCKYGAGTKWCTTTKPDEKKGTVDMFKRYNHFNNLYYIIIKNSTERYAFVVKRDENTLWTVYNERDNEIYNYTISHDRKERFINIIKLLNKYGIPKEKLFSS